MEKLITKICTKCKEIKQLSDFFKDKQKKTGYGSHCKKCLTIETTNYRKNNRHVARFASLKYSTGLTKNEYNKILEKQNERCAICNQTNEGNKKNLSVDHDHNNNLVRGLLCTKCNFGIGYFQDNIEILQKAIDYLNNKKYLNENIIFQNKSKC